MSDIKIFASNLEEEAYKQIEEISSFFPYKIRIMPDAHAGKGCVIGFTAEWSDRIVPNLIGVDIGCGVLAVKIGKVNLDLNRLEDVINTYIPSGRNAHVTPLEQSYFEYATDMNCEIQNIDWIERSMGTLGGGNHFIEVDENENGELFLLIHTGSRNLGKQICEYYQKVAEDYVLDTSFEKQSLIDSLKAAGREKEIESRLKAIQPPNFPKDLCFLDSVNATLYRQDCFICEIWAERNRHLIARTILEQMGLYNGMMQTVESVHNYISPMDSIVRKGAISANFGQSLVIPLNMRDGCIYGIGKGNADWNYSAPHGAGRRLSRKSARNNLNLLDFAMQMNGIYTNSVCEETLDEAPDAYKPAEQIIDTIKDTVDIIDIWKPIYNFKARD